MAGLLTGDQVKEQWEAYLKREIVQHKQDIVSNQAKVTEDEELLRRVQGTCRYCGEYIYNSYSDVDRMAEHKATKHPEELRLELNQSQE